MQHMLLLLSGVLALLSFIYLNHRRSTHKRRERLADHRAMVKYLAAVDEDYGRL